MDSPSDEDSFDELLREAAYVPDALTEGARIDQYVVQSVLGAGGMGDVYVAKDTQLGRKVALKLVRSGGSARSQKRMLREARAAAALEHPNVITIFGVGEHGGETYLAMELVKGKTLREVISGELPMERRIEVMLDVARALAAAHDIGIVHRDIKPDNIMLADDGRVKVLDFGIARSDTSATEHGSTETLTQPGAFLGTPGYASPEQLRGDDIDARTDQFSWAMTAYEVISGEKPHPSKRGQALVSAILTEAAPSLATRAPDTPDVVVQAVKRALAKDRDERFASMADLVEFIAPADPEARSYKSVANSTPRRSDSRRAVLLAVTLVALAGVALYVSNTTNTSMPSVPVHETSVLDTTNPAAVEPATTTSAPASTSVVTVTTAPPEPSQKPVKQPVAKPAPRKTIDCSDDAQALTRTDAGIWVVRAECRNR